MLLTKILKIGKQVFDFSRTYIVGIVNVTPDSFSDGGHFFSPDLALKHIEKLISEGADIIDIGAESTRPGSEFITPQEEINRLQSILKQYYRYFDTPLSLDTNKSEVAAFGIEHHVSLINDVSGLKQDKNMAPLIGNSKLPVIVMHMQGDPKTMQAKPYYQDVVQNIKHELEHSISIAQQAGIEDIIIDPGIGFGKELNHNLRIIHHLGALQSLGCPILVGASRKSFIGAITPLPTDQRLEGSLSAHILAVANGAQFIRVHDVKSHKKAIMVADAILKEGQ